MEKWKRAEDGLSRDDLIVGDWREHILLIGLIVDNWHKARWCTPDWQMLPIHITHCPTNLKTEWDLLGGISMIPKSKDVTNDQGPPDWPLQTSMRVDCRSSKRTKCPHLEIQPAGWHEQKGWLGTQCRHSTLPTYNTAGMKQTRSPSQPWDSTALLAMDLSDRPPSIIWFPS